MLLFEQFYTAECYNCTLYCVQIVYKSAVVPRFTLKGPVAVVRAAAIANVLQEIR